MQHQQRTLRASDGISLRVDLWRPQGQPRFVVVVAHGGGEHVRRYRHLIEHLVNRGALVFGPDHRGLGQSGGERGHVDRFERYADDLLQVMQTVAGELEAELQPDTGPWFLYGHSMGGLISLVYLLEHEETIPLRGAIVSAPLLGLTMKVDPIKMWAGKLAGKLMPRLAFPAGIPPEAISRDADEVRQYIEDADRVDVVTAGWFEAMNAAIERVRAGMRGLELPMLWYAGTADGIVDHHRTEEAFARLRDPQANDQTLEMLEGYFHEAHNEPAELRVPVLERVAKWIEGRLPSASGGEGA